MRSYAGGSLMTLVTYNPGCRILVSSRSWLPCTPPLVLFSECHRDQLAGGILLETLAQIFNHYAAWSDFIPLFVENAVTSLLSPPSPSFPAAVAPELLSLRKTSPSV